MDLLDRLYERLSVAARREYPGASDPSITIAEVYQTLIPYRGVRTELGILELAQYEHALLRLLAGERSYAEIEVPQVAEELQRELATTNPILGVYRDYAAVPIRIRVADAREDRPGLHGPASPRTVASRPAPAERRQPEPGVPEPARAETRDREHLEAAVRGEEAARADPTVAERHARQGWTRDSSPAEARSREAAGPEADSTERTASWANPADSTLEQPQIACRSCGRTLPDAPDVRFCPMCGAGQEPVPCTRCGGMLRTEWNFCIRCGTRRPSAEGGP